MANLNRAAKFVICSESNPRNSSECFSPPHRTGSTYYVQWQTLVASQCYKTWRATRFFLSNPRVVVIPLQGSTEVSEWNCLMILIHFQSVKACFDIHTFGETQQVFPISVFSPLLLLLLIKTWPVQRHHYTKRQTERKGRWTQVSCMGPELSRRQVVTASSYWGFHYLRNFAQPLAAVTLETTLIWTQTETPGMQYSRHR